MLFINSFYFIMIERAFVLLESSTSHFIVFAFWNSAVRVKFNMLHDISHTVYTKFALNLSILNTFSVKVVIIMIKPTIFICKCILSFTTKKTTLLSYVPSYNLQFCKICNKFCRKNLFQTWIPLDHHAVSTCDNNNILKKASK